MADFSLLKASALPYLQGLINGVGTTLGGAINNLSGRVDGKADITNSGAFFGTRTSMENAGAAALPASKALALHPEGNYVVVRAPSSTSDDPLFPEGGPRWGIRARLMMATTLQSALSAGAVIRLISIGGTANDITATPVGSMQNADVRIGEWSTVEVVPTASNTDTEVYLTVAGDERRRVYSQTGGALTIGQIRANRLVKLRRSGPAWRLDGADVFWSDLGSAATLPAEDVIRRANMTGAVVARCVASGPGNDFTLTLDSRLPQINYNDLGLITFAAAATNTAAEPHATLNGIRRAIKDVDGSALGPRTLRWRQVYICMIKSQTEMWLVNGPGWNDLGGGVDLAPVWTAINGKASQASVSVLSSTVAEKAEQSDLAALETIVDGLITGTRIVGDWDATTGVFPAARPDSSPIQAGDQFNVTGVATVAGVDFSDGDRLTALVANPAAGEYPGNWSRTAGTGSSANRVTTDRPGVSVQDVLDELTLRSELRDAATFNLADYMHPDDLVAALNGRHQDQDIDRVTAAVQRFHFEALSYWASTAASGSARVLMKFFNGVIRINDEMLGEDSAQILWDVGWSHRYSKLCWDFSNLQVRTEFTAAVAVRTSGFYAANGITHPVRRCVFRLMKSQISPVWMAEATGRMVIYMQRNIHTDPDGVHICNVNDANFLGAITVDPSCGTGWIIEAAFNSRFHGVTSKAGWNPTEFGRNAGMIPASARFTNVGPVVTCSEPIFESWHTGRRFSLGAAGPLIPAVGGARSDFWSTIESVDSPTQITLEDVPDRDLTGDTYRASFEAIRVSTVAGSANATLSAPITDIDLTGYRITIVGAYHQNSERVGHVLPAVITAHDGDQITLNVTSAVTVVDHPAFFNASCHFGPTELSVIAGLSENDMVAIPRLWTEDGGYGNKCGLQAFLSGVHVDIDSGTKIHGCSMSNGNNYGGNFANAVVVNSTGFRFTGTSTHGGHSPRWGKHIFVGNRIMVDWAGESNNWPSAYAQADVFLMPIDWDGAETQFRVRYDMQIGTFGGDGVAGQAFVRDNGQPTYRALQSKASIQHSKVAGGISLPTYLDDLHVGGRLTGGVRCVPTAQRPVDAVDGDHIIDTTLGKPIWFRSGVWLDALGDEV